ncbi:MAG TPA: tripartite tricarboxylate transporter substrate binding protein [Ramlibacter sp.]|jgi:tripartite-type tricarboxylate transporter receptor subunit TctC
MDMNLKRRAFVCAAVAAGAMLAAAPATAQGYPAKPIRLLVGFPPGTATDIVARQLAERLTQTKGWTIVVENKVGQAGSIAAAEVSRAAPDGYTLLLSANGPLATNPSLYTSVRYDTLRDFTPVAQVVVLPYVLVVNADSRHRTVQDLVAAGKAAPEKMNYSSPGSGSTAHLIAASFARQADVKYTHVPYKGSAESLNGMLGGSIDLLFETSVVTTPLVKAGKLRAIAVTTGSRISSLPDVPTLREAGVPLDMAAWLGVLGPANLPPAITRQLNEEFSAVARSPAVKERLAQLGAEVTTGSPEEFGAFLRTEMQKWAQAVRESNARVE